MIGHHVHINLGCTIGHDVILRNFATIAPGVHISGNVTIGEGVYLGTGVVTVEKLTIGDWSKIGAGSVVFQDMPANITAIGAPAKILERREQDWHLI